MIDKGIRFTSRVNNVDGLSAVLYFEQGNDNVGTIQLTTQEADLIAIGAPYAITIKLLTPGGGLPPTPGG